VTSKIITTTELIERIQKRLSSGPVSRPPYTLILGSGFSFPLIPTTSQIVREELPWWLMCQTRESGVLPADFANPTKAMECQAKRKSFAASFWNEVISSNPECGITLGDDDLPTNECITEAYKLALSADCSCGLSTPDEVRRYYAAMVARVGNKLNQSHLFLASLVAEQPQLFGTIFTTNLDPLLQRAMQMVNVPYFVSDRPEAMQHPDDDDAVEALHLVYAHGSIYRYLLLNSPEQIEEYATRNQSLLQEYFRKHAVLIIGYSGWDDAITRALKSVGQFDHNLYWCDRGSTPTASGLSPIALDILKKHSNAFYVPIKGADELMRELHQAVTGYTLPRLCREPITVITRQLELCDLTGMNISRTEAQEEGGFGHSTRAGRPYSGAARPSTDPSDFGMRDEPALATGRELLDFESILLRLKDADRHFKGTSEVAPDAKSLLRARVLDRLALATDLYFSQKSSEAISHFDFILGHADVLEVSEKATAIVRRGTAYDERREPGDDERAIADYTAVIEMRDVPIKQKAKAHVNRGVTYAKRRTSSDNERAITDFTAAIAMHEAPVEDCARAHYNRGVSYSERGGDGDFERMIADYTTVITMSDAPVDLLGWAHVNRGFAYGKRGEEGDIDREIADYTAVIETPDAPVEVWARACYNRGYTYDERGSSGDTELAIADYRRLIARPDVPTYLRESALLGLSMLDPLPE